jgi:hypothetical protein
MDSGLLTKLFGRDQQWQGPCTVILDANASIQTSGSDSIAGGGMKVYAPRSVSGRIAADSALLMQDGSALLLIQQVRIRQATGEEVVKQTLTVADPKAIIAVEFSETVPLALQALGLAAPPVKAATAGSHPGLTTRPRPLS